MELEQYLQRLGWKKLTILLFIFAGVLVVILFVLNLPTSSNTSNSNTSSETSILSTTPVKNSYRNKYFAVDLPEGWTVKPYAVDQGEAVRVYPANSSSEQPPRITVEAKSSNALSFEQRKLGFSSGGYTETPITVDSLKGFEYSNSFPFIIKGNNTEAGTTQVRYVVLSKGSTVYSIGYEYVSNTKNETEEKFFHEFLTTISIQ